MSNAERLPTLAVSRPIQCKAVRDQLAVFDWEDDLVALARVGHRTCAWWWGARMTPVAFGAFCYVCDTQFTTWSRRWPITQRAQHDVERHKMFHRAQTIPSARNSK